MSTANSRNIIRVPGRLYADPTDLSIAAPYGGTALGIVRDSEFRFGIKTKLVTAEEWGGQTVEGIYGGETAIFVAVIRGYDDDMIRTVFMSTGLGESGNRRIRYEPGNTGNVNRPGTKLSDKAFKLLFAPKNPLHPAIILYRALPAVDEAASLQLSLSEEFGIAVAFYAIPDDSKRVYNIGLIGDLVL